MTEMPPTAISINSSVLEYCLGAFMWELQAYVESHTQSIPTVNSAGSVLGSYQHFVAAAIVLRLPSIRVQFGEEDV